MSTSVDVDEYFATENLINAIFTGLLQSVTFYKYYRILICLPLARLLSLR